MPERRDVSRPCTQLSEDIDGKRGTYYDTYLRFQHRMVESIFVSVHATGTEKDGGSMREMTPLPSVRVYYELGKVSKC